MRTLILAALAASAAATPAFAQSAFTGPRAEAVIGWDHVGDGSINTGAQDGAVYGGQLGYDFQSGTAVFGIEGEVTGATTKDRASGVLVAGDTLTASAGRDFYVGGRLGFLAGSRTLLYAKGGYTNARFDTHYVSGTTDIRDHDNADGWRLGAGAEVKLNDRVYAKAEYRFSKYDTSTVTAERHQVLGGVGVRF